MLLFQPIYSKQHTMQTNTSMTKAFSKDAAAAFIDAIYLMGDTMEIHWKFQPLMKRLAPKAVQPIKIETTEERNTEHD